MPNTSLAQIPNTQSVVARLEEDIVLGLIHPRERLVEDELMARFDIKRHVVRHVLASLEAMGLVERRRNVGALVRAYTSQEVRDLYAVRELLEAECARLIQMPADTDRLARLVAVQKSHDQAVDAGDQRRAFRANEVFHQTLFGLADNPVLVNAIQHHAKRAHVVRFVSLTRRAALQQAREEHWAMIDALRSGERERLITLCRDHLGPSRDIYIETYGRTEP